MIKYLIPIVITAIIFCGCKKGSKKPDNLNDIKISVLLADYVVNAPGDSSQYPVVVQVTRNGNPLSNVTVQFTGSGCNSDLTASITTNSDGKASYGWRLSVEQGIQTLKIVAVYQGIKADSVNFNGFCASSSPSGSNDKLSACTPYHMAASAMVQLSSGRLVACFDGKTSLRYSDDNGISWYPLKGFSSNHNTLLMTSSPNDELFVYALNEGLFYSHDAGTTWVNITPKSFNLSWYPSDLGYTSGGNLILTGISNQIFVSKDKGTSWIASGSGLPVFSFFYPTEDSNGDLYLVGVNSILYKSSDDGVTWLPQNTPTPTDPSSYITCFYIDKQNYFYKSTASESSFAIYVSKDNGNNYSVYADHTNAFITNMGFAGSNFYFYDISGAFYELGNQTTYQMTDVYFQNYTSATTKYPFILANKTRLLWAYGVFIRYL